MSGSKWPRVQRALSWFASSIDALIVSPFVDLAEWWLSLMEARDENL